MTSTMNQLKTRTEAAEARATQLQALAEDRRQQFDTWEAAYRAEGSDENWTHRQAAKDHLERAEVDAKHAKAELEALEAELEKMRMAALAEHAAELRERSSSAAIRQALDPHVQRVVALYRELGEAQLALEGVWNAAMAAHKEANVIARTLQDAEGPPPPVREGDSLATQMNARAEHEFLRNGAPFAISTPAPVYFRELCHKAIEKAGIRKDLRRQLFPEGPRP